MSSTGKQQQIKRSKIVATIGPASRDVSILRQMIQAGMNVARINFSHGEHHEHAWTIETVRRLAAEEGVVVGILGDLQGPKIRLGDFPSITLEKDMRLTLTTRDDYDLEKGELPLPHPELVQDVQPGQRLLLDDGEIELFVEDKPSNYDLDISVVHGNLLKERKGVSAPDSTLSLPALPEKDITDLKFAIEHDVDWIAMSFVRNAEDIWTLRRLRDELGGNMPIVAKVEMQQAIENIKEIIDATNAVMVARGDLGVETDPARVPMYQKDIIRRCRALGKPVITATQMLDSMIRNPRPTRAEAADIANAIIDGTDAVMLSGETASGDFPVESVETMASIALFTEGQLQDAGQPWGYMALAVEEYQSSNYIAPPQANTIAKAVSHAAVYVAQKVDAKWIACSTESGYTARRIARERPDLPIVALTPNKRTNRRLSLTWGVQSMMVPHYDATSNVFEMVCNAMLTGKLVEKNDVIVIVGGAPASGEGKTNFVMVETV